MTIKSRLVSWSLSGILMAFIVLCFYSVGKPIETYFFPVFSKFELLEAKELEGEKLYATFRYKKLRDCAPNGFSFYGGELGANMTQLNVKVRSLRPGSRNAPAGTVLTVPFIIEGLTLDELTNLVTVEVYSNCHALWTTRTKVYP